MLGVAGPARVAERAAGEGAGPLPAQVTPHTPPLLPTHIPHRSSTYSYRGAGAVVGGGVHVPHALPVFPAPHLAAQVARLVAVGGAGDISPAAAW